VGDITKCSDYRDSKCSQELSNERKDQF
jgi:hypothetical protein